MSLSFLGVYCLRLFHGSYFTQAMLYALNVVQWTEGQKGNTTKKEGKSEVFYRQCQLLLLKSGP